MSGPQARQYDSSSFAQYALTFRIEDGCLNAIFAFDASFGGETLELYLPRQTGLHQSKWVHSEMSAKASSLTLVKSASTGTRRRRPPFRTDEIVPQSGIYRVRHRKHRLPHEVTLLRDQQFPKCAKCQNAVIFELERAVTFTEESLGQYPQIRLYELPVFEEDQPVAV